MATYTIAVTLTDSQDAAMQTIAEKAKKTVAQIFQEFWDGYDSQTGAVRAQVNQWISDELKAELNKTSAADVLAALKKGG